MPTKLFFKHLYFIEILAFVTYTFARKIADFNYFNDAFSAAAVIGSRVVGFEVIKYTCDEISRSEQRNFHKKILMSSNSGAHVSLDFVC